jgi:hypothetical protein
MANSDESSCDEEIYPKVPNPMIEEVSEDVDI